MCQTLPMTVFSCPLSDLMRRLLLFPFVWAVLGGYACNLRDLHSLTRDFLPGPASKAPSPNHWTPQGIPCCSHFKDEQIDAQRSDLTLEDMKERRSEFKAVRVSR